MDKCPFELTSRVAIVTGATRGLGLEMVRCLARAGAVVYLNGRKSDLTASVSEAESRAAGDIRPLSFDVTDGAAGENAMAEVVAAHGRLDILVSNVGVRLRQQIESITPDLFANHLATNLVAPYALARTAARHMMPNQHGRLIFVTSISANLGRAGDAAYTAAKGGLNALMRALACEYGKHGITSNAICPGPFATESNSELRSPQAVEAAKRQSPLGRWGESHEIGGACLFLASEAASYVTGSIITVDGGFSAMA